MCENGSSFGTWTFKPENRTAESRCESRRQKASTRLKVVYTDDFIKLLSLAEVLQTTLVVASEAGMVTSNVSKLHESEFLPLLDLKHMTETTTSATSLWYFSSFSTCLKQCLYTDRTVTRSAPSGIWQGRQLLHHPSFHDVDAYCSLTPSRTHYWR